MKAIPVKNIPYMKRHQRPPAIQTTLYELMETVIDAAGPDEKRLINEVTINILAAI
ncbi:MAG: hypothetical protein ACK2TU_04180 [Anaerolineales bacterium]|jgi:hypothetical protein